jgi:glycosyltransferase involved in cell wall biosynthesis
LGVQVQRQLESVLQSQVKHRVSLALPVFNGERYIEQAVRSLLAQTFTDFELIICDNASTDATEVICRRYAALDPRIRYHRNNENLGAARNYNLGFHLSSGEYFRWAAHDDLCAPECLERCVAVLDAQPSVVLCYTKTHVIDEEGRIVDSHDEGLVLLEDDPALRHRAFHERFGRTTWCDPIFGLMRRDALSRTRLHGNYNSADVILLEELALLGKIYEVPEYLFFRRIHPGISTRANPSPQAIAEWFDPTNRGRLVLPMWTLARQHFLAVKNTPLGTRNRIRCYWQGVRWLVSHARGLTVEAWGITRLLGSGLFRRKAVRQSERHS